LKDKPKHKSKEMQRKEAYMGYFVVDHGVLSSVSILVEDL
jgi:hypothetical protein